METNTKYKTTVKRGNRWSLAFIILVMIVAAYGLSIMVKTPSKNEIKKETSAFITEQMDSRPGQSQFLVISDSPFELISSGVVGKIEVSTRLRNNMKDTRDAPISSAGPNSLSCMIITSPFSRSLYIGHVHNNKNHHEVGHPLAFIVTIKHSSFSFPRFRFKATRDRKNVTKKKAKPVIC